MDRVAIWAGLARDLAAQCSVRSAELDIEYVQRRFAEEGESFFTTALPKFAKDLERSLEDLSVGDYLFDGFGRRKRYVYITASGERTSKHPDFFECRKVSVNGGLPKFLAAFTEQIFCDDYTVSQSEYQVCEDALASHKASPSGRYQGRDLGLVLPPLLRWNKDGTPVDFGPGVNNSQFSVQSLFESSAADAVHAVRQLCLLFGKEKHMCAEDLVSSAVSNYAQTDAELIEPFSTGE